MLRKNACGFGVSCDKFYESFADYFVDEILLVQRYFDSNENDKQFVNRLKLLNVNYIDDNLIVVLR